MLDFTFDVMLYSKLSYTCTCHIVLECTHFIRILFRIFSQQDVIPMLYYILDGKLMSSDFIVLPLSEVYKINLSAEALSSTVCNHLSHSELSNFATSEPHQNKRGLYTAYPCTVKM